MVCCGVDSRRMVSSIWGDASSIRDAWPAVRDWLLSTGLRIAITLAVAVVLTWLAGFLINRAWRSADKRSKSPEGFARTKRLKTVLSTLRVAIGIVIWVIAGITILSQLGISIGPLLAGLGVIGVAVGFGAQNLVKDFLAGIFLIVENQLRVGDVVRIGEALGTVENITLRITQVRGLNGHLYTIPNGEIKMVENMTFKWARTIVKVGVSYRSDIGKVIDALKKAASDIKEDKEWGRYVMEPPLIKAIDDFAASSLDVSMWIKTHPSQQWDVGRAARRYIKNRFDEAGIEIPFPQITLTLGPKEAELLAHRSESGPPVGK
jgi:small-conductance mechanosensitive channel